MKKFDRYLPEEPIYENSHFIIYGDDELIPYLENIIDKLENALEKIKLFLGVEYDEKIPINLFNNKETYQKFTRQFYEPAPYSIGNFTEGMINHCYSLEDIKHLPYSLKHELAHLLYETIWKNNYERVLWLDEGLVLNMSDEKERLKKEIKRFKAWFLNNIVRRDKEIPPMEYLKNHGDKYGDFEDQETHRYSGYNLAYLMVRYLMETKSYDEFSELLRDENKIHELEESILRNAISYYSTQLNIDDVKDNIEEVSTPDELMDFMNKNILYGWIDVNGDEHIDTLKNLRTLYKINSLEDTFRSNIGTCIEQAKLIKYALDKMGFETRMFCRRKYESGEVNDEEVKMHCFVAYKLGDYWYHFEHSNSGNRGIHQFDSIESLITWMQNECKKDDIRVITEIPDIPDGLTFREFNEYVNSFEPFPDMTKKGLTI